MSLSSPTIQNPSQHYFEWKGGDGHIEFYDKEKQERIKVPLPFEFIVLDQLNGVTGWSDQDTSGIWSNETRSTRDDFTVRTKKRVLYVGPYKNEQGISQVAGLGGKYVKIIYIAIKNRTGEHIISRIGLTGSALNAWIEYATAHSVTASKVRITGSAEATKGATTYRIPTFESAPWTPEEYAAAVKCDQELQNYLAQALTAPKYDENAEPVREEDAFESLPMATAEQIDDYERRKAEKLADKQEDRAIKETFQATDEIDLSDIPF
jgi:hypothetical protein